MDQDTLSKLRLDRRLALRRGWIDSEDLARELDSLPDVSDKIASADDAADDTPSSEPDAPQAV